MSDRATTRRFSRASALAVALLGLSALPVSAQNLLTNPAFDSGHDGWQPNDSRIELRDRGDLGSTLDGGSGPGALEVRFSHWSSSYDGGHQTVDVQPGVTYDVATSMLVPSADNPANLAGMYVQWLAADFTELSSDNVIRASQTTDTWLRLTHELTAPAGAAQARVWLVVGTPSLQDETNPGVAIFDDAYFGEAGLETVQELFVPAAASAQGQGGTSWSTAGWFSNSTDVPVDLSAALLRQGQSNAAAVASPVTLGTIPPHGFLRVDDLVAVLGGSQLTGGLYLRATASGISQGASIVTATTHTFTPNPLGGGSYGQGIPASRAGSAGETLVPGVFQNAVLRTNIGVLNTSGTTVTLEVRVLDANGNQMSFTGWSLQPYEQRQVGLPVLGVSSLNGGSVTFRVTSAGGSILGYASTVDQVSGDAIYNAAR